MKGILYGEREMSGDVACGDDPEPPDDHGYDDGNLLGEGRLDGRESTVPISAGALERQGSGRRLRLPAEEEAAIGREARRRSFQGRQVTVQHVPAFMSRLKPLFDMRSPRVVERRQRCALEEMPYRPVAPAFFSRSESRRLSG